MVSYWRSSCCIRSFLYSQGSCYTGVHLTVIFVIVGHSEYWEEVSGSITTQRLLLTSTFWTPIEHDACYESFEFIPYLLNFNAKMKLHHSERLVHMEGASFCVVACQDYVTLALTSGSW
jgi:hypothetical protein